MRFIDWAESKPLTLQFHLIKPLQDLAPSSLIKRYGT